MRYVVTQVGSWRVNHDAAGKVVVRKVDRDQKEIVIAIAKWTEGGCIERKQLETGVPSAEKWTQIDRAVRSALKAAATMQPPDTRLDAAELPNAVDFNPNATGKEDPKISVAGWIIGFVLLAVIGVGLYFGRDYLPFLKGSGKANGEACKYDSDCRSDVCDFGQCKAGKRSKGDRCDVSSQCASGKCRLSLCD